MRIAIAVALLLPACLAAQSPFQFREAVRLEHRINSKNIEYSASHAEEVLSRLAPTPADQFRAQRSDPNVYRGDRWTELLADTDRFRSMGGLKIAEQQYLDMLAHLRQEQGASSEAVAMMLDHIAEFYLEARDLTRARQYFTNALGVRRALVQTVERAVAAAPPPPNQVSMPLLAGRLHAADLLTRLGEIDLVQDDLTHATDELREAGAIANTSNAYRHFSTGLDAVYFLSRVYERQGKWQDAETLWKDAVASRQPISAVWTYWNAQKEQAAFYARHGDFHTAANIARAVAAATAGKNLAPELPSPYNLNPRRTDDEPQPQYALYPLESNAAMSEILAIDKWQTEGADAAAPLLQDPLQPFRAWLDRGSDSERAQLLAWMAHRVHLHLSILLDGQPSQRHIDQAYELLSAVKGRFLAANTGLTRMVEPARNNPNAQIQELQVLDQLAAARTRQGHLFVSTALDGKPFSDLEFAAAENSERILTQALTAKLYTSQAFSAQTIRNAVPANAALIDTVVWDRLDRAPNAPPHREYGAFVTRNGQPVRYVRLGAADDIDADIAVLESRAVGDRSRGVRVIQPQAAASESDVRQKLKSLYQKVLAPLEPLLTGAGELLVVPDGKLALAPVGAFTDAGGHFVLEQRTVMYLSSWRDLQAMTGREDAATSAPVIVANPDYDEVLPGSPPSAPKPEHPQFQPLPGAELEAGDVAKALAIPSDRLLTGKRAREEVIRAIGAPEILHFATHSIPYLEAKIAAPRASLFEFPRPLAVEDPFLQSVIAMAGANRAQAGPEDGLLTGLEVASLRLVGTKLVVLSSCRSGQGVPVDGQGVLGLRAAFTEAGANALVMSLWPVDDQAGRRFMQYFYSHLAAGPAAALRQAQLDMMAQPAYRSPFYWAGYVASGIFQYARVVGQRPPAPPAAPRAAERIVMPSCYDVTTSKVDGTYHSFHLLHVQIGGVVELLESSASKAVYRLAAPGSEVEDRNAISVNNQPPVEDPMVRRASELHWALTLTMEKHPDASSLVLQVGTPARFVITLKGGPNLFPTVAVPETLPPLSSYSEATVWSGGNDPLARIEKLQVCSHGQ